MNPLPPLAPPPRLQLRERRVDFAMLYREMHYCYGRLVGLDGIALWSWYRLHQHGGGAYKELTGYGWTGQTSTMAAHGIKHKGTLRKVRDLLVAANLLVIHEARELFTSEEIETLRERARANGETLSLQPGSHLIFAQDPLAREDFVRWNEGQACRACPVNTSCQAYRVWREGQYDLLPTGRAKNDLPGEAKNDPEGGAANDLPTGSEAALPGGSNSDHKPNRTNQTVVHIKPFDIDPSDVQPERLRAALAELRLRTKSIEALLTTPTETAYQIKHLAELRRLGKAPKSEAAWLRSAVARHYRYTGTVQQATTSELRQELLDATAPLIEAELTPEERTWREVLRRLQTQMSRATFEQCFAGSTLRPLDGQEALITVPTAAAQEWLVRRFAKKIKEELTAVLGHPLTLRIEVEQKVLSLWERETSTGQS